MRRLKPKYPFVTVRCFPNFLVKILRRKQLYLALNHNIVCGSREPVVQSLTPYSVDNIFALKAIITEELLVEGRLVEGRLRCTGLNIACLALPRRVLIEFKELGY